MVDMRLKFEPGVSVQSTPLQTGLGLQASNLIRHKLGQIQKYAGCSRLSSDTFHGTARALLPWADLHGAGYIGIGTNELLEVYSEGAISSITPIDATSDLLTPYTTVAGSPLVTITDGSYVPAEGQWIEIQNASYVDGIFLQGVYKIVSVGVGDYVIDAGTNAIAGAVAAGAVITFNTTNTLTAVTITLGAYAFADQYDLLVGVSTIVGGITFVGDYTVTVTVGPVNTITGSVAASSTTSGQENGGNVRINYLLLLPVDDATSGTYGTGLYGEGLYGTATSSVLSPPQVRWTLAQWGEDLLAAYATGTIYHWVPPVAVGNVATAVAGAPSAVNGVFVAAPQQQAVAWGAYSATLGEQDALLIKWCDVADLNTWNVTTTNQAGSFRLTSGARVLSGMWFGLSGLLWTDLDMWVMTYVGFPLVYGFNRVGENCGLISQRAAGISGTTVAWLSINEFFIYRGGQVTVLPCDVHDFIFNNIDMTYADAVYCASNASSSELAWWFPVLGSDGVCTAYVKWNVTEGFWDYGQDQLTLSAWSDQSVFGPPIAADYNGLIQQFETAVDFDGVSLASSFATGFFTLQDGTDFVFLERIRPDLTMSTGGQVQIYINVADSVAQVPDAAYPVRTYGPYTVTQSTPFIVVRARGIYFQFILVAASPNTFWRIGSPLAIVQPDGKH